MNLDQEDRKLFGNIVTELGHIKEAIKEGNKKLDTLIQGQETTNAKLDQIITNTTPTQGQDIDSLGGSISTPKKINP